MTHKELLAAMEATVSAAKAKQTSAPEWAVTEFWLQQVRELEVEALQSAGWHL